MHPRPFSLGIDFGTASVRALIVDTATGEELATAVVDYPSGQQGVILDDADPNLARQHPGDYVESLHRCVNAAVRQAGAVAGFHPTQVVGIGVDTTGSTPIPVDRAGAPLALRPEFKNEPAAQAWLWKDHTSHAEAAEITAAVTAQGLPYLAKCGGVYSSEWYWSKILHCTRTSPHVAQAAHSWVELCDYIPALLTGNTDPVRLARSVCAAGHKAMYHPAWGGLPAAELLDSLSPGLSRLRYSTTPCAADQPAGTLQRASAERMGLPAGIPVAVGAFDAHMGAVGAGCSPGTLVKIMGTSTCDCIVADLKKPLEDIPGVCGIVPNSILPGMYGIEAGQSAVGDIFNWFVNRIAPSAYGAPAEMHARLTEAAARLRPGESGLVALDWHNGNRTVLVDPLLTGLIAGETLATTPAEIYRALIEATAFGARTIIERIESYGVALERVVSCGGIAEKNPLVMQIYADVSERPMYISRSGLTCALGAAMFGAVVGGAHASALDAQRAMTGVKPEVFRPNPVAVAVYRRLYAVYKQLHDAFGLRGAAADLHGAMKELIAIRQLTRGER
ncbi:MAG: ribulokinase [Planctomycetes bacterium]|nr:ribulokinase [Planctomycetota bacterium]